jgi:DivIVA domain-containing protein
MGQLLLLTIGALVVGAIGFGIAVLISGSDPGLAPVEPEGRSVPLPTSRPLNEVDLDAARFDTAVRGYRMDQVDAALRRAAYDIGYKQELIGVLEAEVDALRDGRTEDADKLRSARESAMSAVTGLPRSEDPADTEEKAEPSTEGARS